jgi:hypothetical protein
MNANLFNAIRNLTASQGAAVLLDVRLADENIPVFAGKEPSAERKAFIQCLASGLPGELQKCPDQRDRFLCKNQVAQKMTTQGTAAPLAKEIVDLVDSLVPANTGGRTPLNVQAMQAGAFAPMSRQPQTPRPASHSPKPSNRRPEQSPVPQSQSTVPVQNAGPPGGSAKSLSGKTLVFGMAGGLGAAVGELLSEPVFFIFKQSPPSFMGNVLLTAIWAAIISLGVSVALLIAQNIYLKKAPRSESFFKTMILGILSGTLAGAVAQIIFAFTQSISTMAEIISRIICWGLMACGVGFGVSLFIPNYPRKRAMFAGLLGGIIGGAIFRATFGFLPEVAGRIFGIAILGVFIGLTISIVEEILREAWITVDWGRNETTSVSLGKKPVVFGSSPEADVYLRRDKFPPVAVIVKIENSRVMVDNKLTGQYMEQADGSEITMDRIKITIHVKKEKHFGKPGV